MAMARTTEAGPALQAHPEWTFSDIGHGECEEARDAGHFDRKASYGRQGGSASPLTVSTMLYSGKRLPGNDGGCLPFGAGSVITANNAAPLLAAVGLWCSAWNRTRNVIV
jgi:hypothetical protein